MNAQQQGSLSIVGIGPGRPDWCLPDAADRLAAATDLVGYSRYLDLVAVETSAQRHRSGNRVESKRAAFALDLAGEGRKVVVVSSGDAGIFAMASAVIEQLDQWPERWGDVSVEVVPGVTAAQALAARTGAPLGHDFCIISLSDVLKPFEVIERRLDAAAGADFVMALYNPISRHRPWQFGRAVEILRTHRDPDTPVILGRNVGRSDERIRIVTLADLPGEEIDMSTVVIVGSSTTRVLKNRPLESSIYTPRWYGTEPERGSTTSSSHASA